MKKILDIADRLEEKRRRKEVEAHRKKLGALQRVVQCAACHFRCAMCGYHLEGADSPHPPASPSHDFHLCESCRAEFEDFLKMTSSKEGSRIPWHNKEWMKMWSAWVNYQKAIREFRNSGDFRQSTEMLSMED
jgi:hypothetical protein